MNIFWVVALPELLSDAKLRPSEKEEDASSNNKYHSRQSF